MRIGGFCWPAWAKALQNFAQRYRVFSNNLVLVRPTTNGFMRDPVVLLTRLPAIPHAATGARKTNLHEFLPTLNTHLLRNQITLLLDKCFQDPILFSYIFTLLSSTPQQRKCEPRLKNTTLCIKRITHFQHRKFTPTNQSQELPPAP